MSGYDVTDAAALDAVLEELDDRIGLDRLRALHVNDAKTPLGLNSDRHDNVLDGLMGEKLGVFLGHPKLQGLPAVLEVPGTNGKGPGRRAGDQAQGRAACALGNHAVRVCQVLRSRLMGIHNSGHARLSERPSSGGAPPSARRTRSSAAAAKSTATRSSTPAPASSATAPSSTRSKRSATMYVGCMQKVFDVEIDLDLLLEEEAAAAGAGPRRAAPASMCEAEVASCYEAKADELGCVNFEFSELPLGTPSPRLRAGQDERLAQAAARRRSTTFKTSICVNAWQSGSIPLRFSSARNQTACTVVSAELQPGLERPRRAGRPRTARGRVRRRAGQRSLVDRRVRLPLAELGREGDGVEERASPWRSRSARSSQPGSVAFETSPVLRPRFRSDWSRAPLVAPTCIAGSQAACSASR